MHPEFRKQTIQRDNLLSQGHFALGLVVGIVLALFSWLAYDFLTENTVAGDAKELVPAISTSIVALISVFISVIALKEQRIMRQAGTDPVLVAHLGQRADEPIMLALHISNVGAGAAMNVYATVDLPANATPDMLIGRPFDTDVLNGRLPVKVILQNERVSYELGTGPMLLGDHPLDVFKVNLVYQDIEGSRYSSSHEVNVAEMKARPASSPATTKIWRELEKVGKNLGKIAASEKLK